MFLQDCDFSIWNQRKYEPSFLEFWRDEFSGIANFMASGTRVEPTKFFSRLTVNFAFHFSQKSRESNKANTFNAFYKRVHRELGFY